MDIQKINDYIDAYSKAIELPKGYKEILKELMTKIIEKYSKTISSVSVKEDDYTKYVIKPVNGEYSIEDFFLNRLMRNVLLVDNTESVAKGDYQDSVACVGIDENKLKRQLDNKEGIDKSRPDFQEIFEIARKKVIMHEFEHALQTQVAGEILPFSCRENYRKIFEEVSKIDDGKYADKIQSYEDMNKYSGNWYEYETESSIHMGLHYGNIHGKLTYRNIIGEINLCEIFNETEALEMAEAKPQIRHTYPNGVYYVIKNIESSNYPITNYGNILKTLIGEELTFTGMYLNPENLFKTFNAKYNDIFQGAYSSDKDAWQILIEQLNQIKKSKRDDKVNYELNQKLQETLARCLEKDINIELQKSDVDFNTLKKKIVNFRKEALNADDKETRSKIKHFAILKSLKDKVESEYAKQQEGIDVNAEKPKVDRWTARPITEEKTEGKDVADKWIVPRTVKRTTMTVEERWVKPKQVKRTAMTVEERWVKPAQPITPETNRTANRWVSQNYSKDEETPDTDTTKGGDGGNFGLAQEMGQTQYQIESEKRKQELSFSAVKMAVTKAKITEQEVNDETLRIKEKEELDILKRKGFAKTSEERARYNYLKSKYEPPAQKQSKGQSR